MTQIGTVSYARPSGAEFRRLLVFAVLLINALVIGIMGWALYQNRLHYQERAEAGALSIARLLEQNLAETFERVERNMQDVVEEVVRHKRGGAVNEKALNAFLQQMQMRFPEMFSIRIVDAEGFIEHGVGKTIVYRSRVEDREYFRFLRERRDAGTYVSKPTIGRSSGERVLIFSRRVNNPDGSFGGVVNATVEISYFAWLFSAVDVGPNGVISLRNEDLGIIVRLPDSVEEREGQRTLLPHLQSFVQSGRQYGTFVVRSPLDGINRSLFVRKIGNFPLYLIVGAAHDDYLAAWWRELGLALFGGVLFLAISVWLTRLLMQSWVERQALIDELNMSRNKYHALAELSAEWFWEQDANFRFINVSSAMARKYARTPDELNGKARWEIGGGKSEEDWCAHRAVLEAHQQFQDFEYFLLHENGAWRCISVSGEPVFGPDGHFAGYRGVGRDITEKKRYEERIAHMAQFDALTDLPNRALFQDRVTQAISIARREQREFALLYFDLDRFKSVNDRHGHGAGDQLLRLVAERIRMQLRESDTVARVGGDEFAVLLPAIVSSADAEEVARRIVESLTSNFQLDSVDAQISVGVSIGIAIFPRNGTVLDELFKAADEAMYVSKKSGNQYSFA